MVNFSAASVGIARVPTLKECNRATMEEVKIRFVPGNTVPHIIWVKYLCIQTHDDFFV